MSNDNNINNYNNKINSNCNNNNSNGNNGSNDLKNEFINFLIDSDALLFGEFTTKSGRQSPYFINTGKFKTGTQMKKLGNFYAMTILEQINSGNIDKDVKVLFGPAYKGIPLVVATSIALSQSEIEINYCFNRKEVKDHGEGGNIVGYDPQPGDKVLIIEDVITAGTAVREILPVLRNKGVEIAGLVVSVDRMEKGLEDKTAIQSLYDDEGIKTYPIVTLDDIIQSLEHNNIKQDSRISKDIQQKIQIYREKYCMS